VSAICSLQKHYLGQTQRGRFRALYGTMCREKESQMAPAGFKVWRILEEQESKDGHGATRIITKKELIGDIENPKEEIFVGWPELVERFGEGYYLVEIPVEIQRSYIVPEKQLVRTPAYFEPSAFVRRQGNRISYKHELKSREEML
jgi:hypothetical protein